MYPQLVIDVKKLKSNTEKVLSLCHKHGISSTILVVKVFAGFLPIVEILAQNEFDYIGDSRLENLERFQNISKPKCLLRIPSPSQAEKTVRYANLSLNSELETIKALNEAAQRQNKIHDIILMFDLGDLREGIFFMDDYLPTVKQILTLKNIHLKGIGTNLTCYGGVIPTVENLTELVNIKTKIETQFSISLDIISGGNSSSFVLLESGNVPKDINNLRFGEIVYMGRETAYGNYLEGLYKDIFTLEAEIVELKQKPSYPIGVIGMNSFGEKPNIPDQGTMTRAILAIGKQDVILENLTPKDKSVSIIGGSSDHLIVGLSEGSHKPGDIIAFDVNYPGLLHLMNSHYIDKVIKQ
ncbi:MAG TPA: alanine/ornithine racemase family PLP-dependent enzyme [Bacillota bacterium]|nr:alanine/ornithine racemase family PLP-dependent enzyme [Bacillota bacterium]HPF41933.1 alanine/ornithine racemase family PLP-dependent enzyme [Bacillota bacterium]HPJ85594.1 alanine/ornithine racemase family PLP-dependent enzyme [Bacillota bacterium]HPQ61454.1 alanine/ornithine racemase family PLP-dependent enzyme [Bacillota bacterium]HRX91710.1 alanine/ornithine racemase family PLP-dependent enzyme [Candidatus Izemoplasmatales bacterium]